MQQLAEELYKVIIRKFEKPKIYLLKTVFAAYANMQLISKCNK